MSIANRVESARKALAPIVAIPIEGETPFCVRRQLLVDSLKGLRIVDAGIQLALDGSRDRLVVYAAGPKIQAIRHFRPIDHRSTRMPLWEWAAKEREKRLKPKTRTSARQKKIEQLRKRLAKMAMRELGPPAHPLLDDGQREVQWRHERDTRELQAWEQLVAGGAELDRPRTIGQQWSDWKCEARIRRWIQAQARACAKGSMTTTQLYRVLGERGIVARKWSNLNTHDKERCENVFGYLKRLWEFCGITPRPTWYFDPAAPETLGARLYQPWLEQLHARKELLSIIASLEQIETAGGSGE